MCSSTTIAPETQGRREEEVMNLVERIRESSTVSWGVAVGAYLLAAGASLTLRRATHGST